MSMDKYFDISRFWFLMKVEWFRSRKALLMTFVIAFGLLFFMGLIVDASIQSREVFDSHPVNFAFTLILGGFIISSLAFNDLGNTLKRYHFLMLPVSALERFICMWLFTSVGWIVVFTLVYKLHTIAANAIGPLLFHGMTFPAFDPFGRFSMNSIRSYFVLQGIFLAGAAYFRGFTFPKTLLALIIFLTVSGTIAYVIMKDSFFTDHDCGPGPGSCALLNEMITHKAAVVAQWLFWWILAPLCWLAGYLGNVEVNPNTIVRTCTYLQEKGILLNKRGIGYFVAADGLEKTRSLRKQDFINQELPKLFKTMGLLNFTMEDIRDYHDQYQKKEHNGKTE
jgi:hypothetical protein